MNDFTPRNILQDSINAPFKFTSDALALFKNYNLNTNIDFSVISNSSLKLLNILVNSVDKSSSSQRYLIHDGNKGNGKSVNLLQAVVYAYLNDWLIFYIPKSETLVDSSFNYLPPNNDGIWNQPKLTSELLKNFAEVNKNKLVNIKVKKEYDPNQGESLYDLCNFGVKYEQHSCFIFDKVFEELNNQEFNTLIAVDNVHSLYQASEYRDVNFNRIHPYELSASKKLLDLLSGNVTLKKGLVLSATSSTLYNKPIPSYLLQKFNLNLMKPADEFKKPNEKYLGYLNGLQLFNVNELSFNEAVGLFESYSKSNNITNVLSDELLLSKYIESGKSTRQFIRGLRESLQ